MATLSLTLDDDTLRRAQARASRRGTSVDALLRDYVEGFAEESVAGEALREALEIAERSSAGSGPGGRSWTRDELYER